MLAQLRAEMASSGSSGSHRASGCSAAQATPATPAPPAAGRRSSPAAGRCRSAACGGASFALNVPSEPMATGASFQVPVVLNGGDGYQLRLRCRLHYDPAKLMLINVAAGDFLSRDGQAASVIHTDEPAGNLTIGASRPPGMHGVSGTGVVCVLTFQAKAAGPAI